MKWCSRGSLTPTEFFKNGIKTGQYICDQRKEGSLDMSSSDSYHPSLGIHRNLAYNILKYLEDDIVRDKEIPELHRCSECNNEILTLPPKEFTILTCGHLFHRLCIEKKLLFTVPNTCPFPNCGKNVDILGQDDSVNIFSNIQPVSNMQDSPSSQSSGISSLTNMMNRNFVLSSPPIKIGGNENTATQQVGSHLRCAKCFEDLSSYLPSLGFLRYYSQSPLKPLVYLTCKHVIHYSCIDNSRRLCPICPSTGMDIDNLEFPIEQATQRRRTSDSFSENTSRKKAKKSSGRDNSPILKRLIQELSTDSSEYDLSLQLDSSTTSGTNASTDFLKLYKDIVNAEDDSKKTAQELILRYFHFGKALKDRYDFFRKSNHKRTSQGLVNDEVRKQIPKTISESLLRKTKERAQKIYEMFSELGVDKIKRIKTFTVSTLATISQDDIDYVLAKLSAS